MNKKNQPGGMHLIIIIAIVVLVVIGGLVYVWLSRNSTESDTSDTSQSQEADSQAAASGVSVTMLSGKLMMTAVDGWTKGTETNLIKDIDGTSFKVAIQPQGVDYLKLDTIGGYAIENSTATTTQDTKLYILKMGVTQDATNLVVSTCAPTDGFGCAPDLDSSKLYIVLAPLGDGSSTIAPLDYNLPATATAISDFEQIAGNLPL
ncbi:MAG TPA: hypothetical protein VFD55_02860 [Candidatus Angelobacter sp.]|nr:hypothetical protein [Candidatus Angelobacter sp.]